jgi:hypothetical protein
MASRITEKNFNLDDIIAGLDEMAKHKINVGPVAKDDAHILLIAGANEYGATITPKNGKFLAVPLCKEARGKSPKDFPDQLVRVGSVLHKKGGKKVGKEMFVLLKKVVIPERSFLRATADSSKTLEYAVGKAQFAMNLFIQGKTPAIEVLNAIGLAYQAKVRERITSNISPGNSPLTIALKGSGKKTLNDSGRLQQSIDFEVVHA